MSQIGMPSSTQRQRAEAWKARLKRHNREDTGRTEAMRQVISGTSREDMARTLREHGWVTMPPTYEIPRGESINVTRVPGDLIVLNVGRTSITLKANEAEYLARFLAKAVNKP